MTIKLIDLKRGSTVTIDSFEPPFEFGEGDQINKYLGQGHFAYVITRDYIRINGPLSTLFLNRYYKDDYDGYFNIDYPGDLLTDLSTFDCRTKVDKFKEIFSAIRQYNKSN